MACYIFVQLTPFQAYYHSGILELFFINLLSALHEFRNGQCLLFFEQSTFVILFLFPLISLITSSYISVGFFKLFTFTFTFSLFIDIVFCTSLRSSSFIYLTLSLPVTDLIRESYGQQFNVHYFHTSKRLLLSILSFDSSKDLCSVFQKRPY